MTRITAAAESWRWVMGEQLAQGQVAFCPTMPIVLLLNRNLYYHEAEQKIDIWSSRMDKKMISGDILNSVLFTINQTTVLHVRSQAALTE